MEDENPRNVKAETCTEEGYSGDMVCARCEEVLKPGEVIPALGHNWKETKAPTCEEKGVQVCQRDGCEAAVNGEEIPALGHDFLLENGKEATCTDKGYTGDSVCQREGCDVVEKGKETEPLGHMPELGKVDEQAPTETETGWTVYADYFCQRCGVRVDEETGTELTAEEIAERNAEHIVYAGTKTVRITANDGEAVPTVVNKSSAAGMTLSAEVIPAAADQKVTWKSSAPTVIYVDESGRLEFLKNGKATITATTADKHSGKVTIQVTTLAKTVKVSSKTEVNTVGAGKTLALAAAVEPADTVNKKVVWSVVSGGEYAQVSTSGVVTAKKVLPEGDGGVTVRADAADGGKAYGEFQVQVLPLADTVTIDDGGLGGKLDKNQGYTRQLTAVVTPENASQKVIWSSSNTKVATVNEDGVVTAERSGTTTITAKTVDGSNRSAKYILTVTAPITRLHLFAELTMKSPDPHMFPSSTTLGAGKSMTITAVAEPEDATTKKVFWYVDNTDAATISTTGVLKAKNVLEPVDVTVTAVSQENPDVDCSMTVTIYPSAITKIGLLVDGVQYNKTSLTIENLGVDPENYGDLSVLDKLHSVKAIFTPSTASTNMRWTQNNYDVLGIVDYLNGEIRLNPQKAGTCVLTGAALDGSGKKVTLKVTVTQPMTGLQLPETAAIAGGKSLTLKPTIEPANTTNKKLTWEISSNAVGATVSNGVLKTKAVQSPTTVTVTATAMDGSNKTAECTVIIYPITTSVEIQKDQAKVTALTLGTKVIGDLQNSVELTAVPKAAKNAKPCDEVKWTSSNEKVATVVNGTVTAVAPGKATITAAATDGSGKKTAVAVTVVQPMTGLRLPETAVIAGGKSLTLKPTVEPTNTTNKKLGWTVELVKSADGLTITDLATVSNGVLKTKAPKTLTQSATVRVIARALDGSGVEKSCDVTIYPAVTKITLTSGGSTVGSSLKCYANQLVRLGAETRPNGAYPVVTWKSSSTKVAVVNENGVVIPLKPGTVTITATAADGSGKKASVKITILAPAN